MITLETLEKWLVESVETEDLEFKEAKNQFDTTKLMRYCVAIANERGGYLVFGVTDKRPRKVVGSQAFATPEVKMFPRQALRELIANALIHQDFLATGTSVMIEMYSDRVEISNPGIPPIRIERFIDEYRSRNEQLADIMRRFNICEEKGSGIDKVIHAVEDFQLPAPDFRVGETRTTAVLFVYQDFADMSKSDRIRACYQHCCLLYVSNQLMSNQTLRERFSMNNSQKSTSAISIVIRATKEDGLIKQDDSESASTRYARYIPFWA